MIIAKGEYEVFKDGKYTKARWTTTYATKVTYANDTELYFGAMTIRGPIGGILEEGDTTKPDQVCLWGKAIGVANPQKAICSKHAQVEIK